MSIARLVCLKVKFNRLVLLVARKRSYESVVGLVSFMDYDPGFFDQDEHRVEPMGINPFAPDKVLTMCPV